MDTFTHIKEKIKKKLQGAEVKIADEGAMHQEHGVTGAHVKMMVIWKGFEGKTLIEQHQMIYDILKEEMKEMIHSLRLKTQVE